MASRPCADSPVVDLQDAVLAAPVENQSWLPAVEWCAVAILSVIFVAHTFVPAWQTLRSEFPNYYLAAQIYHRGTPLDRVYEWTWFQRQNDHLGIRDGLVGFAPNPPTLILSFLPLTSFPPLAAKRIWLVINLLFFALALLALRRTTSVGLRQLILIAMLCVLPLSADFLFARHYVFILFLVCAAYYAAALGKQEACGFLWSAAAAMKLFPAVAVIPFIQKRNWRALAGFLAGGLLFGALSVAMFGVEVHRVFLTEVLSQASRGDWLGPYSLSQNSFVTLWSRLFLFEPELNSSPVMNSPTMYAVAFATTTTAVIFAFLWVFAGAKTSRSTALHWAAAVPLMLLLSTTPAPDHACLLIFTAIVGFDALYASGNKMAALALLFLYAAACAPVPERIAHWLPLSRLVGMTAIYGLLLLCARVDRKVSAGRFWLLAASVSVAVLSLYNLHKVRNRDEDFSRRVPTSEAAFRSASPAPVRDGIVSATMQPNRYRAVLLTQSGIRDLSLPGDVLGVSGSAASPMVYAEMAGRESSIVRLPIDPPGSRPAVITMGQEPVVSPNGKWLAFLRQDDNDRANVYRLATGSNDAAQSIIPNTYQPIDITVSDEGDVIAAAGRVSDPHLVLAKRGTAQVAELTGFPHPARYPSISPDGTQLAFSRRDGGVWHLFVRGLNTGDEQQLTHAFCNATSPSWANDQTLLYASDCGRGIGLSAIVRVTLLHQ